MDLAAKLQLTPGQRAQVVKATTALTPQLPGVVTSPRAARDAALVVFVSTRSQLTRRGPTIAAAAGADRLTWVAYPKAGQLATDLNRDSVAAALTARGLNPVRQIAIDDVWSALRFRVH